MLRPVVLKSTFDLKSVQKNQSGWGNENCPLYSTTSFKVLLQRCYSEWKHKSNIYIFNYSCAIIDKNDSTTNVNCTLNNGETESCF
jgi:hypothetical protein